MKTNFFRRLGFAALLALFAGCESDDYGDSGDVNFYGTVGYSSFYDPWYGGYYGGGGIIVSPPVARPPHPAHLPTRPRR